MSIQNPNIGNRAVDFFKQMANKLIDTGNNVAVKYGNGAMTPRFETINDKQAQEYQTVVNNRNILDAKLRNLKIKEDPRNNNYVYNGNVGYVSPPSQHIKVNPLTPTPTQPVNKQLVPTRTPTSRPQPTNQPLIPTRAPTKIPNRIPANPNQEYPLPTTTPYPSPTPIPGLGKPNMTPESNVFLDKVVYPMAQRYDVHPAIAAAQFGAEGRLFGWGAERNNFFNVAMTDAVVAAAKASGDLSKLRSYPTPEAGVEGYLKFISGTAADSEYANGVDGSKSGLVGKKQFAEAWRDFRHNPEAFLEAIGPTYASSGKAYAERATDNPEYYRYKEIQDTIDRLNKQLASKKKRK